MKHIKKSFLKQTELGDIKIDDSQFETIDLKQEFNLQTLKKYRNKTLTLQTEHNVLIEGFLHNVDGKCVLFPIPDPTLIYFHSAQINLKHINPAKQKMIEKLSTKMSEGGINEVFNFYSYTSSFVIFLFTAIESFINQQIPDNYIHTVVTESKRGKTIVESTKIQIQESFDFKTKLTIVLPKATGKDYFKHTTSNTTHIYNLKEFRDGIIHTKDTNTIIKYDFFVQKALSFKYLDTLLAVANFMNFYKPDYIIECNCGIDY